MIARLKKSCRSFANPDSVIFDTDIFILAQRLHKKALAAIDSADELHISVQTYMEFLQGAKNKQQLALNKAFLNDLHFEVLPFTENIGHRAAIYVEQFSLSHSMQAADALIAATAVENNLPLVSANAKHFRHLPDLELIPIRPDKKSN